MVRDATFCVYRKTMPRDITIVRTMGTGFVILTGMENTVTEHAIVILILVFHMVHVSKMDRVFVTLDGVECIVIKTWGYVLPDLVKTAGLVTGKLVFAIVQQHQVVDIVNI